MEAGFIRICTTRWCPDGRRAKHFLRERGLAFDEIEIKNVQGAAEFVRAANVGRSPVPTFVVNGRVFHCSPYDAEKLIRELSLL